MHSNANDSNSGFGANRILSSGLSSNQLAATDRGAAILTTVCLLLILVLGVLLYASNIKLTEFQLAQNSLGFQQSRWHTQARIELTLAALRQVHDGMPDIAVGNNHILPADVLSTETFQRRNSHFSLIDLQAEYGGATAYTSLLRYPIILSTPEAPLVSSADVELHGHSLLVTQNGENAMPVSVITAGDIAIAGPDARSCLREVFERMACSIQWLSSSAGLHQDMRRAQASLNGDVMERFFGWTQHHWQQLADLADHLDNDCEGLPASGFIWIQGDCQLRQQRLGSAQSPVLLIVQDGALILSEQSRISGLVVMFRTQNVALSFDIKMDNNSEILGSVLSNQPLGWSRASIRIFYDAPLLARLVTHDMTQRIAAINASRRDF